MSKIRKTAVFNDTTDEELFDSENESECLHSKSDQ